MPHTDRPSFIALLDRLGDPDDSEALAAARELHRRMKAAELEWEELFAPGPGSHGSGSLEEYDDPDVDVRDFDIRDVENGVHVDLLPVPREQAAEFADELHLIDGLLARRGIAAETRRELADLRNDIASGDFGARDCAYVRDLSVRLERLYPPTSSDSEPEEASAEAEAETAAEMAQGGKSGATDGI